MNERGNSAVNSTFITNPPDDWFTPPGTLRMSTSALQLARQFRAQAKGAEPDEDWIISFDWADSRRVREKGSNEWRDLGSGIDLTAYERWKIADKHIQTLAELEFVVKIPPRIWENSIERLIDTDADAVSGLVLR
jgi:hypothetical protein